jgi:hypothetical protein
VLFVPQSFLQSKKDNRSETTHDTPSRSNAYLQVLRPGVQSLVWFSPIRSSVRRHDPPEDAGRCAVDLVRHLVAGDLLQLIDLEVRRQAVAGQEDVHGLPRLVEHPPVGQVAALSGRYLTALRVGHQLADDLGGGEAPAPGILQVDVKEGAEVAHQTDGHGGLQG